MTIKFTTGGEYGYNDCSDEDLTLLMDAGNNFDFSSQSLSSSCPSTSGSYSSTSSLYEPFTPTSRTSTPQHINCSGSYGDDSTMDFTPPLSATSGCFPRDITSSTVEPTMLITHGLPSTPQRCNPIFDNSLSSHCSLDFTPNRDIGLYHFDEGLYTSPSLDIQSAIPLQFDINTPNFDLASIWGHHGNSSPVTFASPSLMTPTSSPYDNHGRVVAMNGPQLSSTRLQQQTQPMMFDDDFMMDEHLGQQDAHFHSTYQEGPGLQTPSKSRTSKPRPAAGRTGVRSQFSNRVSKNGPGPKTRKIKCITEKVNQPSYPCTIGQCNKKYMRAEHLKRHQGGAAHKPAPAPFICTFCKKNKTFDPSRRDNFKDHIKRHTHTDRPGNRTPYHPEAALLVEKLAGEDKGKTSPKNKKGSELTARKAASTGQQKGMQSGHGE